MAQLAFSQNKYLKLKEDLNTKLNLVKLCSIFFFLTNFNEKLHHKRNTDLHVNLEKYFKTLKDYYENTSKSIEVSNSKAPEELVQIE
jgi:hypothetical protein